MKHKNWLLILICILFVPCKINASYIYGDYQEYKMNTDELLEESDVLKREEITLYNTYEYVKEDLGYLETCENYDENDVIEEDVKYKTKVDGSYGYQPVLVTNDKHITAISIYNFKEAKKIYELNVYYDGKKIDYEMPLNYQEKYSLFQDNDLSTSASVKGNDTIYISFKEKYDPSKLLIEFIGDELSLLTMNVFCNNSTTISSKFTGNYIYFVDQEEYDNLSQEFGNYAIYNTASSYTNVLNHYRKKVKKYHCYEENKVIKNEYVLNGNNILLDDYITRYNYFIRTKEEIEEELDLEEEQIENIETIELINEEVNNEKKVTSVKTKKKTTKKVEKIEENNGQDIIKVEPLKNEIKLEKDKFNILFYFKYFLLIIFILQILAYCLHRKK